jgi:poly-gamma-glutamate capsule biosynthesis protein CapA/YwtB (metallophosphatase superfamily)
MNVASVSLANNHALDYGPEGLAHTLEALRSKGIGTMGAGLEGGERSRPFHRVLGNAAHPFPLVVAAGMAYRPQDADWQLPPGVAGINMWTLEQAVSDIKAIRRDHPEGFLVAFPHWGLNYRWKTDEQTAMGHKLIEAGADLVIGHGAHMVQEIELYQGRWILYSLGNFVFNSPGRYSRFKAPPFSLLAELEARWQGNPSETALRLYPIVTDNSLTGYQPRPVTQKEFEAVYQLLLATSPTPDTLLKTRTERGNDEAGLFLLLRIRKPG